YAPRIFESMGAAKDASMLQTIVMGLVNVIFTVVAIMTVDKWGRKPLLIFGSIGMAIGMFGVAAMAFSDIIGIGTLLFIIIFTASFMMSWGPICWVLISEINTQQIGPHDIINEAVKIIMNNKVPIPIISEKAIAATPNIPIAIPMDPNINRGLRPHLSTVIIATTVKITFTNPITIVCNMEASFAAPILSKIRGA